MNILLIDQPLWNRGDESAHKGLVRSLLKTLPDARINVMEINVSQAAIGEFDMKLPQVNFINIRPANEAWYSRIMRHSYRLHLGRLIALSPTGRKIIRLYDGADIVVMAPGGINLGGFQDWRHLSLLLLARSMGKPLAYYGRSIGPFPTGTWTQRRFRRLAAEALGYCRFVSLRDEKSVRAARELGISCTPTVDCAFLDTTETGVPGELQRMVGDGEYIVFVPNELVWHYAYRNTVPPQAINRFYARLVKIMLELYPGRKIVMLPQTNNQTRNDYQYFCELRETLPKEAPVIVVPDTYSSDVQQAVIRQSALVVGARYHSIVFAVNQGVPFISLSYEHKMAGLLECLGETDRMIDITGIFNDKEATDAACRLFESLAAQPKSADAARAKAKGMAKACFDEFVKSLEQQSCHNTCKTINRNE